MQNFITEQDGNVPQMLDLSRGFGWNNLQIIMMKHLRLKTADKLDKSSIFTVSDIAVAD